MGFGNNKKPIFKKVETIKAKEFNSSCPVWFHPEYYFNHIAYAHPDLSDCIVASARVDNVPDRKTSLNLIVEQCEDNSVRFQSTIGKQNVFMKGWSSHYLNALADMTGAEAPSLDLSGYSKPNPIATAKYYFKHSVVGKALFYTRYHVYNITNFCSISRARKGLVIPQFGRP